MSNLIQEHIISPEIHASLQHVLSGNTAVFVPSEVYNALSNEKTVKPELRNSTFRNLTDKPLFDLCNKILDDINEKNSHNKCKFLLFENDIMHIKYSEGEYFKVHEDYLSLNSNIIEEYSMIICINADCDGGETILHFNDYFKYQSKASVTPGSCLLFRKDIPHEGSVLKSGHKEIITLNLWKIMDESQRIVVVKFNDSNKTCVIAENKIIDRSKNNLLKTFLKGKEDSKNKILFYNANCPYEDFLIIDKIYKGYAISCDELYEHKELIDYYQFNYQNLLVKNFSEDLKKKAEPHGLIPCYSSRKNDVILFNDEGTHIEFIEQIKINNLSYVPFKILLGEGTLTYGGGMEGTPPKSIKMMPLLATFSERNNVMYYCNPMTSDDNLDVYYYSPDPFVKHIYKKSLKKFKNIKVGHNMEITGCDDRKDDIIVDYTDFDFNGSSIHFNLGISIDTNNYSEIIKFITIPQQLSMTVKKESAFTKRPSGDNSVYYVNSKSKLSLKSYHYEKIIDKVEEIDLYDTVISKLNSMSLIHSQKKSHHREHFYCNENVYGTFSFLMIYGALKID